MKGSNIDCRPARHKGACHEQEDFNEMMYCAKQNLFVKDWWQNSISADFLENTRMDIGLAKMVRIHAKDPRGRPGCTMGAMFLAYYNFVWRTHDVNQKRTRLPAAMAVGVTETLMTFEQLFDKVMGNAA